MSLLVFMLFAIIIIGVAVILAYIFTGPWHTSDWLLIALVATSGLFCVQGKLTSFFTINAFRTCYLAITGLFIILSLNGTCQRFRLPPFLGWYLILTVLYFISSLSASFVQAVAVATTGMGLRLLSYVIVYQFLGSQRKVVLACKAFCGTAALFGLYGFYQQVMFWYTFNKELSDPLVSLIRLIPVIQWNEVLLSSQDLLVVTHSGIIRVKSVFWEPNLYGGFTATAFALSLGVFLYEYQLKSRHHRFQLIIGAGIVFIVGLNLLMTFSRSAWVGVSLGMIVFVLTVVRNKQTRMRIFIALLALAALFVPIWAVAHTNEDVAWVFNERSSIENLAEDKHIVLAQIAWDAIRDKPFIGVGYEGFGEYYTSHPLSWNRNINMTPHSAFLQWWAETGIGAFLINIGIIFTMTRLLWSATQQFRRERDHANFSIYIGILAAYASLWGSNIFYGYPNADFVWVFTAIAGASIHQAYVHSHIKRTLVRYGKSPAVKRAMM